MKTKKRASKGVGSGKIAHQYNALNLKAKILLGFILVLILVVFMALNSIHTISTTNKKTEKMIEEELELLILDNKLTFSLSQRIAAARGYVLFGDQVYKNLFDQYTAESVEAQEHLLAMVDKEETKKVIEQSNSWTEMVTKDVFAKYDSGDLDGANRYLQATVEPYSNTLIQTFEELTTIREDSITKRSNQIIADGKRTMLIIWITSVAVILLGITVAIVTAQMITKRIKLVTERMIAIADRDLSADPLAITTKDEIGQMAKAMNKMQEMLKNVMVDLADASETLSGHSEELTQSAYEVKSGSEQVSVTMQELATGSETQANTASDLAIVMDKFTEKVRNTNQKGNMINSSSQKVLVMTNEGTQLMESSNQQMAKIDDIVQEAVEKMTILDNQTQEISKLVSIIQTVSDQTNLLALNAAIEAARAGEQGRGFAVVADEVRKLAEQVAVSITDITGFVTTIQSESRKVSKSLQAGYSEVEEGAAQIKTTGKTFNKISASVTTMVNDIQTISDNLDSIAANSEIMNSSIEEIASVSEESAAGVEQTSAASQQISSSMEEVAGSSEQLAKLAEDLNGIVTQFKF